MQTRGMVAVAACVVGLVGCQSAGSAERANRQVVSSSPPRTLELGQATVITLPVASGSGSRERPKVRVAVQAFAVQRHAGLPVVMTSATFRALTRGVFGGPDFKVVCARSAPAPKASFSVTVAGANDTQPRGLPVGMRLKGEFPALVPKAATGSDGEQCPSPGYVQVSFGADPPAAQWLLPLDVLSQVNRG